MIKPKKISFISLINGISKALFSALLLAALLLLPSLSAHAQDTPPEIREPAIRDLQSRLPSLGRPNGWSHRLEISGNSALNCPLVANPSPLAQEVNVYIVTLLYGSTAYTYHVSEDGALVVPCDDALLREGNGEASEARCTPALLNASRLRVGGRARVATADLPLHQTADNTSVVLAGLPFDTTVTVLAGPQCATDNLWWLVEFGAVRGYLPEHDFTNGFYPLEPIGTSSSDTCPQRALNFSRLVPRNQATVTAASVGVYQLANFNSEQVTSIPNGTNLMILDGPDCDERGLFWFVDYGGARGYVAELDYITGIYDISRAIDTPPTANPPQANPPQANPPQAIPPAQVGQPAPPAAPRPASGLTLNTLAAASIPLADRSPIDLANVGRLTRLAQIIQEDSIAGLDVGFNGLVAVHLRGMAGLNNVLLYNSLSTDLFAASRDYPLNFNENFLGLSPSGELFAYAELNPDGSLILRFVNTSSLSETGSISPIPNGVVYAFGFSHDNLWAALAYTSNGAPRLTLHNLGASSNTDLPINASITALTFSEDDQTLVGVDSQGMIYVWSMNPIRPQTTFQSAYRGTSAVALNPDASLLALAGAGREVELWDMTSGLPARRLTVSYDPSTDYSIRALAFNPEGTLLATGGFQLPLADNGGNSVLVFDVETGTQLVTLIGHRIISGVHFNASGNLLLSYGETQLLFWSVAP